MVTRSMSFPEDMYDKLKQVADNKGVSIAVVIKLACDEYIKQELKDEQKK